MEKANFFDFSLPELADFLVGKGFMKFRAKQLFKWAYQKRVLDWNEMTDISVADRQALPQILEFKLPEVLTRRISKDGTEKFLFDVGNNMSVEAVLIPADGGRNTLCVSSEVGCNLGCKFCYTGKQKLKKRLSTGEIVGQLYQVTEVLPEEKRVTNIVYMGMGEPLDNPDAVFPSIKIMHEPTAFNIGLKKITVSTSGIVPLIKKVTESGARLAVSLNGSNDEVRTAVMPINKRWNIEELFDACRDWTKATGDKVTFEYVLLKDVTDFVEQARELHKLTSTVPCKINIIPFNEHPDSGYQRPSEKRIVAFQEELIRLGSHVLRRKTMGRDIYAACGQLTTAAKKSPDPVLTT